MSYVPCEACELNPSLLLQASSAWYCEQYKESSGSIKNDNFQETGNNIKEFSRKWAGVFVINP